MRVFDVIVVGAGPAGEVVAGRLAEKGHGVAVVESELVGGECSFYACMPSKALLRPADALAESRRVPGAAEAVTGELDVEAVLARRDQVIHDLDDSGAVPWLEDRGIALIRGHARLEGERRVRVGELLCEAREAVVIAVGSAAAMPAIPGLAEARPWTNREVTTARRIPGSLVVLGGGVVGVEMAQAYSALGSTVTLIEAAERLLTREEPFAASQLHEALAERGVDVHVAVEAQAVRRDGARVTVDLSDGGQVEAHEILVAVGRRPRTDDLGLETVGLEPGKPVAVDDMLRVPGLVWLYAIGDVNERSLLTHMGKYQAHVASEIIDGGQARATRDDGGAPRVVFTDPQVAAVGLTLQAATDQGLNAHAYDVPSSATAGASFYGRNTPGTSRLVVDEDRGVIVGRDVHRHRRSRVAACGHDRPRQRDPRRAPVGSHPRVSHAQRNLAQPARKARDRARRRTQPPDMSRDGRISGAPSFHRVTHGPRQGPQPAAVVVEGVSVTGRGAER